MTERLDALTPGSIVGGRYRIRRLLGQGGMGAVYEAEHTSLGRVVALKMLLDAASSDGEAVARFFQEARSAAGIGHPGIVEVFDLSQPGEPPFLVMERLEGEELRDLMKRSGPLPVETVLPIAVELCDAVGAAHANGIVHRDLKPDNVFLARKGDHTVVKVLDFGIAKLVRPTHDLGLTTTGQVFGTPLYMAPEQMRGVKVDQRTDVYALGAILYECLAGHPPFNAETVTELVVKVSMDPLPPLRVFRQDLPPALSALVEQCLAKAPDERPPDARTLAASLRAVAGGAGGGISYLASPTRPPVHATTPLGHTPPPVGSQGTTAPMGYGTPPASAPISSVGYGTHAPPGSSYPGPGSYPGAGYGTQAPGSFPGASGGTSQGTSTGCLLGGLAAAVLLLIGLPTVIGGIAYAMLSSTPGEDPGPTISRPDPSLLDGPRTPPPPVEPPPPPPAHVRLNDKISPLVANCTNWYSDRIQRARNGYFGWADREGGPTGQERYIRGVSEIGDRDGARCRDAVNESNEREPRMADLEAEATRYRDAVTTLAPLLGQAHDYYERETYRDDGMAGGRRFHPQLVAAFDAFDAVDETFREHLLDLEEQVRAGRVAELEADPSRRDLYLVEWYQQQALRVARLVVSVHIERDRRLHSDQAAEFIAAVEELQQRADVVTAHTSTHDQWDDFRDAANDYLAAALRTMRALRDGTEFSRWDAERIGTSSGWMTEGSPEALVREYDELRREVHWIR